MDRFLSFLAHASTRHSLLTVTIAFILAALSLVHALRNLKIDTNQDSLISKDLAYFKTYEEFLHEFGDWEYIYVVIKGDDEQQLKSAGNNLVAATKSHHDLFVLTSTKINWPQMEDHVLLLLPNQQFETAHTLIKDHGAHFLRIHTVTDWFHFLNGLITTKNHGGLEELSPFFKDLALAPFDEKSLRKVSDLSFDDSLYFFNEKKNILLVRLMPQKDYTQMEIVGKPLKVLRSQVEKIKKDFPDLEIGVTGRPVLQNDEAVTTQNESTLASIFAFVLVGSLYFFVVKDFRRPLFSLTALAVSMAWTLGLVSVTIGRLNLITFVFAIILIGIGVDYGIHFLLRYLNENAATTDEKIIATTRTTGIAIVIGTITSSLAFATALFTDFLGLQELGFIAAAGLVLCCLSQLTVFPALLHLFDKKLETKNIKFVDFSFKPPKKPLLLTITLLTLASLPLALTVPFNHNLLELQNQTLESVRFEKTIQKESPLSTWFLSHKTGSLNELKNLRDKINDLDVVKKTESIFTVVPESQHERLALLRDLKISSSPPPLGGRDKGRGEKDFRTEFKNLKLSLDKLASEAMTSGYAKEVEDILALRDELSKHSEPKFEKEFLDFIRKWQKKLPKILKLLPITEKNLPTELLANYKSQRGNYTLMIFPKKDIWKKQNLDEFIKQVRMIIPDVTGAPITTKESGDRLVSGFATVLILTAILVIVVLLISLKSFKDTILTFLNLVVALTLTLACMKIAGLSINLANFFALPILLGTGIDHGVHIVHCYRESHDMGIVRKTALPAIVLSCLTTILGFGPLSFVSHVGLASFGMVMSIGTFFTMVTSLLIVPTVLESDNSC